jgi:hypothetical protein
MTNVKIVGLRKLQYKIGKLQREQKPMLVRATQKALIHVNSTIPKYPAKPSGSTYRRTGTMGRSFTTEVKQFFSEIVGVIGNPIEYAPWVISEVEVPGIGGPQADHHRGRWYTLQDVVRKARQAVIDIYLEEIDNLL